MQRKPQTRGRPRAERLDPADVVFIKKQITDTYVSLAAFYAEAVTEAKNARYKGFKQPCDVETVDRAFDDAFSGRRSLPELYWKVLEDLLAITRDSLPSRATTAPKPAAAISWTSRQRTEAGKVTGEGSAVLMTPTGDSHANARSPLALDLEVLVAPLESPAEYRLLAPEVLPVKAGQPLRLKITTSRPAYLYAFWVNPASKVQALYPWKPGQWEDLEVELEQAVTKLNLPWSQGGPTLRWTITAEQGLETLVVLAREEKMLDNRRAGLRGKLVNLPVPKAGLTMPRGPHEWRLGGSALPGSRGLDLKARPAEDPVGERHGALERRLFGYYDVGKCLSFLNAGRRIRPP